MKTTESASGLFGRATIAEYAVTLLQLVLLVVTLYLFNVENNAFTHTIMPLALGGFAVNYWLPAAARLPLFTILSLAGILMVFGIVDGLWLIAICLYMIGLCHLPVGFAVRIVLLLA